MKLQKAMFALTAMMFLFAGKSSAQQGEGPNFDRSAKPRAIQDLLVGSKSRPRML